MRKFSSIFIFLPGPKLAYDPSWSGPMSVERKKTDNRCYVYVITNIVLWLLLGSYGKGFISFASYEKRRTSLIRLYA